MARMSIASIRRYWSEPARSKRKADRKVLYEAYQARQRAFDKLRFGNDEDFFVSVSLPSKAGTSPDGIRNAAEPHVWNIANKHARFSDPLTVVPGSSSDQPKPFVANVHLEGANKVRLPADTKIFVGDQLEFGDGTHRWIVQLTSIRDGENFKSFRFKDPCSSSVLTGWLRTTDHVLATWSLSSKHISPTVSSATVNALRENGSTEFKSKVSRDGQLSRKGDHAISKTVAAFANAAGGVLVIGRDDTGKIVGLAEDYRLVSGGSDGFERRLRDVLSNDLKPLDVDLLDFSFEADRGQEACVVTVQPSKRPVFCRPRDRASQPDQSHQTDFWIRDGNRSRRLTGTELSDYLVSDRFTRSAGDR